MQELVLQTIHSYRTDPDDTAAEESWDYAQFQVCELATSLPVNTPGSNVALQSASAWALRRLCVRAGRRSPVPSSSHTA